MTDRYRGADAARDFQLRDAQIANIKERIAELDHRLERMDESHPPQQLLNEINQLRTRVRALEATR